MKKLNTSGAWIGEKFDEDDMEFIAAFILENLKIILSSIHNELTSSEAIEALSIPKKKKYTAYYEIWGSATLTEKYKTTWKSYYKDWVKDSLRYSYNEGNFDYYEGHYLEHESDNFDRDTLVVFKYVFVFCGFGLRFFLERHSTKLLSFTIQTKKIFIKRFW